jgi:hypothetical protein
MKLIYVLGAFALALSVVSCNEQPKETTTTIIETEKVIEVPKAVVVEVETPKAVVVEEKKETSIKIGPDGGSLNTKKVDIEINK